MTGKRYKLFVNFIKKNLKTEIKNGNTTSKLLKKFSVFVDIRNNAFVLSGFTERIYVLCGCTLLTTAI